MALDTPANRSILIRDFPELGSDPFFRISSPLTTDYNCIAWAMGFTDRWVENTSTTLVNTVNARFIWWPPGVKDSRECDALIKAFEAIGFEITNDGGYDPIFDKAVLYTDGKGWTHASRITGLGEEHSKFGEGWDAYHGKDKFRNTDYGEPYAIMQRLHARKQEFIARYPIKAAGHIINLQQLKLLLKIQSS